jgi:hypothetical protein
LVGGPAGARARNEGELRKMSYEIMKEIAESRGDDLALVTVIEVQGSVPRHAGSKMLSGTVGGGKCEARAIATAMGCLRDGTPRVITLRVPGGGGRGSGHDLRRHQQARGGARKCSNSQMNGFREGRQKIVSVHGGRPAWRREEVRRRHILNSRGAL